MSQRTTSTASHFSTLASLYTMAHGQMPSYSATHLCRCLSDYRILICLRCNYAVPLANLRNHLRTHQRERGSKSAREWMQDLSHFDLLDPACEAVKFPLPTALPIPDLPGFDGYACVVCSLATRQLLSMKKHHRQARPSNKKPERT